MQAKILRRKDVETMIGLSRSTIYKLVSGLSNQSLNTNIVQGRSSLTLNFSRSISRARIRGHLVQRH
ncbi:AlpA family phage regulatory protein [Rhodobacteraceae bacterium IMCC15231]|nr:AlpA family phage regulatory protein [Rhodobacteraceae bacterium IMCC15231]